MTQKQLAIPNNGELFQTIDITISEVISVIISPNSISLKLRENSGKLKSISMSREAWFQIMSFKDIIEICFFLKHESTYDESTSLQNTNESSPVKKQFK